MSDLRVWHIPQLPGKPFHYYGIEDVEAAKHVLKAIAQYDLFLLENNHRVDFSNTNGLECYEQDTKEWVEWADDEGRDIDTVIADEPLTPVKSDE